MKKYDNERVSIVMPLFNAEKYIRESLDSALRQKYDDLEIVIVDDCSTDSSADIVREYAKKDKRIHYFKLEVNSGAGAARNYGIKQSSGRYIAFLDSDDIWESGKLENQVAFYKKHGDAPFIYTAIEIIDENGKVVKEKRNVEPFVDFKKELRNTMVATSTVIIDREVVPTITMPNRRNAEDYSLWLTLLRDYGKAYGINAVYTKYRNLDNSASSNRIAGIKHFYDVQTEDIGISGFVALINTFFYSLNAVKKYYF